jgi:uncharacterized membrane protein
MATIFFETILLLLSYSFSKTSNTTSLLLFIPVVFAITCFSFSCYFSLEKNKRLWYIRLQLLLTSLTTMSMLIIHLIVRKQLKLDLNWSFIVVIGAFMVSSAIAFDEVGHYMRRKLCKSSSL